VAGIRSGGIKYALGKQTAIGTRAIDEGLPLLEHTMPVPITDALKGALTTRPDYGMECDYHIPGTVYYISNLKIPLASAWACRLLDIYFENTVAGAAANYTRIYYPEDIPAEPSEWLSLWKYTAKTGFDHNTVGVGGVIRAIAIEGSENQAVTLSAEVVFASREDNVATGTPADWDINESSGSYVPWRNSDMTFYVGAVGIKVVSWRVSLSHNFRAHFWGGQNPNRISRLGPSVQGEFVARDVDDDLEAFEDALKDSDEIDFLASKGSESVYVKTKIHAAGIREERGTRYGHYNFTGLAKGNVGLHAPLKITLLPQVAGL
jgi:hypothetical protein